mgnify:FL=1
MARCCKGEDNHLSMIVFSKYRQIVMLRYINTDIVFQEFPDEVTLTINISGCPCRCPGCHSQFLWADRGEELTAEALSALIRETETTITCVGFIGAMPTLLKLTDSLNTLDVIMLD